MRAHEKGLELIYHVYPSVPDSLIGDAGRMRQIIVNLVGNAVKFTERGEVAVHVRSESQTNDEVRLHFIVQDTGIGVPPEKQNRIFGAFSQSDSSTTRKYGGTGLGLAISTRLVGLMGGRIWVESPSPLRSSAYGAGPGSIFHFIVCFSAGSAPAWSPVPEGDLDLENLRLLVVDDNATSRRCLEDTLKNWRMNLRFADGSRTALDLMTAAKNAGTPFDLVILDANMPGMDGFELAEKIQGSEGLAGATIMMLTSVGIRGDAARCSKVGVAAYLVKPISRSELFDAITRVLSRQVLGEEEAQLVTRHSLREAPRGIRLLLAEDNPVNQMLAVRMLEKRGFSVQVAESGKKVLSILDNSAPDDFALVLMDIQMPEMDGFEVTAAIREREKKTGRHIPIVALTAHAMKGDRERCIEAGMDDYITKPIRPKDIFGVIEKYLPASKPGAHRPTKDGVQIRGSADDAAALDTEEVLARVDGDMELLKEVGALFLGEYPKLLVRIREAIAAGSGDTLRVHAHTLKGMLTNLGARGAFEAALGLEEIGREDRLAEADEAYAVLEGEVGRFVRALEAFLEQSKA